MMAVAPGEEAALLDLRRRDFIILLGGAGASVLPVAALGQRSERRLIGGLTTLAESDAFGQAGLAVFREELQKLGWTDGRNIRIDIRWARGDAELLQRFAKELVALQPDLILGWNTPSTTALLQQTRTIPIIFQAASDPVGSGFVASFSRPGGNVTGFTNVEVSQSGKWLELLKEIAPRVTRVAFCSTRQPRHMLNLTCPPSKPPPRPSQWRRSQPLFGTGPNSYPSLPQWHASQTVALSSCRMPF
jgi:putative ABC transport system substrate-binding protein